MNQTMDLDEIISKHKRKCESIKEMQQWSGSQAFLAGALSSTPCETALALMVVASMALMIIEADHQNDIPKWMSIADTVLLVVYILEMLVRVYIFRLRLFQSLFNVVDLLVILMDVGQHFLTLIWSDIELPSVVALRAFRLLRLARGNKVIMKFPQLALMVKGLMCGVSAAFYGVFLLLVILTVWAVFAVHLIDPVNQRVTETGLHMSCERCPHAFSNVRNAILTFIQQIIAGDSWGQVTMPIIEESPETAFFFGLVFVSVQFTVMNVILAVIVESASQASKEDVDTMIRQKQEQQDRAQKFLFDLCRAMDTNGSGDLTEPELMSGYEFNADFRDILLSMDINKEDMSMVFRILDADGSGYVDYQEFIKELFKMKSHDSHTLLVFIKHYTTEIRSNVREQLSLMKDTVDSRMKQVLKEVRRESKTGATIPDPGEIIVEAKDDNAGTLSEPFPARPDPGGDDDVLARARELAKKMEQEVGQVISRWTLTAMLAAPPKDQAPPGHNAAGLRTLDGAQDKRQQQAVSGQPPRTGCSPRLPERKQRSPQSPPQQRSLWGLQTCCAPVPPHDRSTLTMPGPLSLERHSWRREPPA